MGQSHTVHLISGRMEGARARRIAISPVIAVRSSLDRGAREAARRFVQRTAAPGRAILQFILSDVRLPRVSDVAQELEVSALGQQVVQHADVPLAHRQMQRVQPRCVRPGKASVVWTMKIRSFGKWGRQAGGCHRRA